MRWIVSFRRFLKSDHVTSYNCSDPCQAAWMVLHFKNNAAHHCKSDACLQHPNDNLLHLEGEELRWTISGPWHGRWWLRHGKININKFSFCDSLCSDSICWCRFLSVNWNRGSLKYIDDSELSCQKTSREGIQTVSFFYQIVHRTKHKRVVLIFRYLCHACRFSNSLEISSCAYGFFRRRNIVPHVLNSASLWSVFFR